MKFKLIPMLTLISTLIIIFQSIPTIDVHYIISQFSPKTLSLFFVSTFHQSPNLYHQLYQDECISLQLPLKICSSHEDY